jgi:hypothetical protein
MRAEHHLFWLEADHGVSYFGAPKDDNFEKRFASKSLRALCAQNDDLRVSLTLHLNSNVLKNRQSDTSLVKSLVRIMGDMRAGNPVHDKEKRFLLFHALGHGAPLLVTFVKEYWEDFARFATPQYRQLVPLLRDQGAIRQGLLLHRARPTLYLWSPPQKAPVAKKLLVCFTTSSNTLNAPLPLAHVRLTELGIPLLYVYTPSDQHPGLGAAKNWDVARTAQFVRNVAMLQGYDELYGLGTSLGGYTVCRYGEALDFKRILNFSGSAGVGRVEDGPMDGMRPDQWAPGYDHKQILSILSRDDVTDQRILQTYDAHGFETQRLMLPSDRHGSLTSAWIGGQLDGALGWLLSGRALDAQQLPRQNNNHENLTWKALAQGGSVEDGIRSFNTMADPHLSPNSTSSTPTPPRRQFAVQTFTASYDPVEDRIRLNAVDKAGVKQSILLTRRLMDQVIPVIAKDLEAKTPQGVPADIVQSMTQERVRQVRREASASGNVVRPVRREAEMADWLCRTIHFKRVPNGLVAVLTEDSTVDAVLPLAEANLRALLDIFRATYAKASWNPCVFPEWMKAEQGPSAGQGARIMIN